MLSELQKEPAASVTAKATAAVTGGRFVTCSGNRTGGGLAGGLSADLANVIQVAQVGTAGGNAIGVAEHDMASGSLGRVHLGGIATVESGAALTAGVAVMSDALGRAVAYNPGQYDPTLTGVQNLPINIRLGTVMTGAGGAGLAAEVLLLGG